MNHKINRTIAPYIDITDKTQMLARRGYEEQLPEKLCSMLCKYTLSRNRVMLRSPFSWVVTPLEKIKLRIPYDYYL